MAKFSKQYNMDQKRIKSMLRKYKGLWTNYNEILELTQFGKFNTVIKSALNLIEIIEREGKIFRLSSDRVKKIYIKKWISKFGRQVSDPYKLMKNDLVDIIQAIRTRKEHLNQQGITPENEGD